MMGRSKQERSPVYTDEVYPKVVIIKLNSLLKWGGVP